MNFRVLSNIRVGCPELQRVRKSLLIILGTETSLVNGYVMMMLLSTQHLWKANTKLTWPSTEPCALRHCRFFWIQVICPCGISLWSLEVSIEVEGEHHVDEVEVIEVPNPKLMSTTTNNRFYPMIPQVLPMKTTPKVRIDVHSVA